MFKVLTPNAILVEIENNKFVMQQKQIQVNLLLTLFIIYKLKLFDCNKQKLIMSYILFLFFFLHFLISYFQVVFEIIIQHFLLPFPNSKPSHITFRTLLHIHGLFDNGHCQIPILILIHIHVYKYSLLSLYSSFSIYAFRAYCLTLGYQLVCSSFEGHLSHSQFFSVACTSFGQSEVPVNLSLYSLQCLLVSSLFRSHFRILKLSIKKMSLKIGKEGVQRVSSRQ